MIPPVTVIDLVVGPMPPRQTAVGPSWQTPPPPPGQTRRGNVQFAGFVRQTVLGQDNAGCAEGIGLDDVRPRGKILAMNVTDNVRRQNQMLVAAVEGRLPNSQPKGSAAESSCPWRRRAPGSVA